MVLSLDEMTIPKMWISDIKHMWYGALGYYPWHRREPERCDFCGRRLADDKFIARMTHNKATHSTTFFWTCLNHGTYEGQVIMDCFTAQEMTLRKEPRFYHETAMLHEARFFINATIKFVHQFLRQLPLEMLYSVYLPIRKAIERQEKRLGYR